MHMSFNLQSSFILCQTHSSLPSWFYNIRTHSSSFLLSSSSLLSFSPFAPWRVPLDRGTHTHHTHKDRQTPHPPQLSPTLLLIAVPGVPCDCLNTAREQNRSHSLLPSPHMDTHQIHSLTPSLPPLHTLTHTHTAAAAAAATSYLATTFHRTLLSFTKHLNLNKTNVAADELPIEPRPQDIQPFLCRLEPASQALLRTSSPRRPPPGGHVSHSQCAIIYRQATIAKRQDVLLRWLKYLKTRPPNYFSSVYQLFYDGYEEADVQEHCIQSFECDYLCVCIYASFSALKHTHTH